MLGKNFFALDWHMKVTYASAEITEYTEGQRTSAKNMKPVTYMWKY